jgi:hypothetical protein
MSKQTPSMEWTVVEDDTDWERLCAPSPAFGPACASPVAQNHSFSKQVLASVAALLLFVTNVGGWWYTAQAGLHGSETDVCAATERVLDAVAPTDALAAARPTVDSPDGDWWLRHAWEVRDLRTASAQSRSLKRV